MNFFDFVDRNPWWSIAALLIVCQCVVYTVIGFAKEWKGRRL